MPRERARQRPVSFRQKRRQSERFERREAANTVDECERRKAGTRNVVNLQACKDGLMMMMAAICSDYLQMGATRWQREFMLWLTILPCLARRLLL